MEPEEFQQILGEYDRQDFVHVHLPEEQIQNDTLPNQPVEDYPDYYAVLNVDRLASKEEIKAAYRRLSIIYHPDKLHATSSQPPSDLSNQQEQLLEFNDHATQQFALINSAYQILSDEATRKIYDTLGHTGLEEMMQVSRPLKTPAEIRAEYQKMRYAHKMQSAENLVRSAAASMEVSLDATSLFDYSLPDDQYDGADIYNRNSGGGGVEVAGLQLFQVNDVDIDSITDASLSGVIMTRNNKGGGYIMTSASRKLGPNSLIPGQQTIQFELAAGTRSFGTISYQFPFPTKYIGGLGSIQARWERFPWLSPPELTLSASRAISSTTIGSVTYKTGPFQLFGWGSEYVAASSGGNEDEFEDSLELGLKTAISKKSSLKSTMTLSSSQQSLKFKYKRRIDDKLDLEAVVTCNSRDAWSTDLGSSLIVVPNHRYASYLQLDTSGQVALKLALSRYTTTLSIPITLSHEFDWKALATAISFPFLSTWGLRTLLKWMSSRHQKKRVVNETRRQQAILDLGILRKQVSRKIADEEQNERGIVIMMAVYGPIQEIGKSESNRQAIIDLIRGSNGIMKPEHGCIDITIQLQMLVSDGRLQLFSSPKHKLLGLFDPCPGEEKCIWIEYKFRGKVHRCTCGDFEKLVIPLKQHQVTTIAE